MTRRELLWGLLGAGASSVTLAAQKFRLRIVARTPPPSGLQTQFIGGNIGLFDYTPHPYADLVSGSRGFGYFHTYTESPLISRDANGWPTEASEIVVVGNDRVPSGAHPNGTYAGSYDDSGATTMSTDITAGCSVTNVSRVGSHVTFDLVITANPTLVLEFNGPVRNLKILFPGHTSADVLRTSALNHFKQFWCLRSLDWMNANYDTTVSWGTRTAAGKRHGAQSWEALFAVATAIYNASGSKMKALWINVPYLADATYVTNLAALAASSLPSGMILYVEYSNEIWNYAFPVAQWLQDQANDTGNADYTLVNQPGTDTYSRMQLLWGIKIARIAGIFLSAFGGAGAFGTRIRPVLAGQHANIGWSTGTLTWTSIPAITGIYGQPNTYIYALSTGPYVFGGFSGQMDAAANAAAMLAGLRTGWDGSLDVVVTNANAVSTLRANYGITELTAYEWGLHTNGGNNKVVKYDTHLDPNVKALVTDHGMALFAAGFSLLNYYTASPEAFGNDDTNTLWPVCQDFTDSSYKLQGLQAVIAATGG